jgi:hypothetical protein
MLPRTVHHARIPSIGAGATRSRWSTVTFLHQRILCACKIKRSESELRDGRPEQAFGGRVGVSSWAYGKYVSRVLLRVLWGAVVHLASRFEPEQTPVRIADRHDLGPPVGCRERPDDLDRRVRSAPVSVWDP